MAKPKLRVRELSAEEEQAILRLTRSRTEAARLVERARIIRHASQGSSISEISRRLKLSRVTVGDWIKRFNQSGLDGLQDLERTGRPNTYTPEQKAEVIATALTDPKTLDLEFASWTLDRLEAYLNEVRGIAIKRSRIDELLVAEGLRWRSHETWFGERVDPDFVEKRGPSKRSTRRRQRTAW